MGLDGAGTPTCTPRPARQIPAQPRKHEHVAQPRHATSPPEPPTPAPRTTRLHAAAGPTRAPRATPTTYSHRLGNSTVPAHRDPHGRFAGDRQHEHVVESRRVSSAPRTDPGTRGPLANVNLGRSSPTPRHPNQDPGTPAPHPDQHAADDPSRTSVLEQIAHPRGASTLSHATRHALDLQHPPNTPQQAGARATSREPTTTLIDPPSRARQLSPGPLHAGPGAPR
jgi:hypothetical protein